MAAHILQTLNAIPTPLWTLLGVLVGAAVSTYLTSRWQHRQWVMDNKKAEYRAVLDLLGTYRFQLVSYLATYNLPPGGITAYDPKDRFEERNRFDETQVSLSNALGDRLFIRKQLARRNVRGRFEEFVRNLDAETSSATPKSPRSPTDKVRTFVGTVAGATTELSSLHQTVVEIAEDDLGLD